MTVVESNGTPHVFPMLLDMGCDHTCFPAYFSKMLGHDNQGLGVQTEAVLGIGGRDPSYLHTMCVGLSSPQQTLGHVSKTPPVIWRSTIGRFRFVEKFTAQFGLIGRDMIKEWKAVSFSPHREKWAIKITI